MRPSLARSVPWYLAGGGAATLAHYAAALALAELGGIRPLIATMLGFVVGAAIKYWANYRLAFQSDARHRAAMTRFAALLGIMWCLNSAVFFLFAEVFRVHYMLAQVLTTAVLIPPGFLLSREWVFR